MDSMIQRTKRSNLVVCSIFAWVILSHHIAKPDFTNDYYISGASSDCEIQKQTIVTLQNQILALTASWPSASKPTGAVATEVYSDGTYTIKLAIARENLAAPNYANLDCTSTPNTGIQLISATYGFPDDPLSGPVKSRPKNCQVDVKAQILDSSNSFACLTSAATCSIEASNKNFGDPCKGSGKILEIFYQCVPLPSK